MGEGLGKTTGWIHRTSLKNRGVHDDPGRDATTRIDDAGPAHHGRRRAADVLEVDTIVLCAGQEPRATCTSELLAAGVHVHLIGGADVAAELDAKRAIEQGTELAAAL